MGIWSGILLFSRVSQFCSASNVKWQLFQKTVWLCVCQKKKSQNKNKRTPRSLHEVCSHANDACTFLGSRWTVKALVLALSTQPQLLALPSPLLTRKGSLPKSCPGSTLGLLLTSSAKWNVCFIQDYNMEFKWLRTLKWGENRLADDFLHICVEIRTMEKAGNAMVIVEVGSTSGWFSNGTLWRRLESFEKAHHALRQLISTPGDIEELLGRTFKRQPCPL